MQTLIRISARWPAAVAAAWLLAVLVSAAMVVQFGAGAFTTAVQRDDGSDSVAVEDLLRRQFGGRALPERANEVVVVRSDRLTVDDPGFRAQVELIGSRLMALGPGVLPSGTSWYLNGDPALLSPDRRATLLPLVLADPPRDIERVRSAVLGALEHPGIEADLVGRASVGRAFKALAEADLRAELKVGLPVALVVLLVVFSTAVAAVLPLLVSAAAIAVTLAMAAFAGQWFQAYFLATNMVLMMGLALGIDYSLFILSRYREERREGRPPQEAMAEAGRTAGRAVLFSGLTVMLALLGLLLLPTNVFRSLAAGAMLVALASVLASATLLPALVLLLGGRLEALRLPFAVRGDGTGWAWVAGAVCRRPRASLLIASGLLVAAALPALRMEVGFAGIESLPDSVGAKRAFQILQKEFSVGVISEAAVAIDGDAREPVLAAAVDRLRARLAGDPGFLPGDARLRVAPAGEGGTTASVLSVPMRGDAEDPAAQAAIRRLRASHVPEAFAGTGARVLVGGSAAAYLDFFELTARYTPIVLTAVLGLSFLLLMVAFRSIVVPLKAIAMNLLSVGAAYGLMVLVFQDGVGARALGLAPAGQVEAWIPLFLFVVLYALSMDYHVLLLSRIRERYEAAGSNARAVLEGLGASAGVITGAALIMVAIFAGFAAGELVMFQQIGFGLAVAVLIDASLVRAVIVPAAMTLLGERNWYLPRWLAWLPRA